MKLTKTIYRIEHPESGWGICRHEINDDGDCVHDLLSEFRFKMYEFPTPWKEGLDIEYDHFCAFKSINQIKELISYEEFLIVKKHGFKVYEIEVEVKDSHFQEAHHQVIFKKKLIISSKDITNTIYPKLKTKKELKFIIKQNKVIAM